MDALVYSKRMNNIWPDAARVAGKVRMAYELLLQGRSFYHLQQRKVRKQEKEIKFKVARAKTPEQI